MACQYVEIPIPGILFDFKDFISTYFDKFMELTYNSTMFKRAYEPLDDYLQANKVLVIYGPKRVGKTTILQSFLSKTSYKYKLDSGDNIRT